MIRKTLFVLAALFALALPTQAFAAPKPKVNFSKSAYAIAENDPGGAATITVLRQGNPKRVDQTVSVDYATADGTAKAGVDYTAASGTLTFAPGETSKTFSVPVINNNIADGARTLSLKLSNATASGGHAMLGFPSTAALVIADDDTPPASGPTFQMAVGSDVVSESATTEPVYVVRSGDLGNAASVNYATANGSAVAGLDYTSTSGTASFPAGTDGGAILQQVNVPILHNPAADPATRDFSVNLSLPGGATAQLGTPSSETVTIVNSDGSPTVQFSSATYSVAEKDGSARLTVLLSGSISGSGEVDVNYATADGTAFAGTNYTSSADTLQFFAGDVAASFDVPVRSDGQPGDKTFTAALSSPTGGGVLGAITTATVTIRDSDAVATGPAGPTPAVPAGPTPNGCGLTVKAAKKQRLLKKKVLTLTLRARVTCKVTVTTSLKQLRPKTRKPIPQIVRALRLTGKKTSLTLQPGKAKTVKVKFTKKTFAAISKALRARKTLVATFVVTTRDSASHVNHRTLKITTRR